ncbi:hypothetical protein AK88_03815 [Plasmodium fragile]|uniref:Uncharacterized protein n=1 Tax=Plasmodium fragile TaxID=5857 RepID=A0A0D9QHL7_PLAFR|nr:uncharacterized protein AK88_03815 [Plasmodium fragile]KJP86524.1 hypothetical protein AK88_03815 [Plasmodium fragile]
MLLAGGFLQRRDKQETHVQRGNYERNVNLLLNQCEEGRTFKFVVIVRGEELILKGKAYENGAFIEVGKFLLNNTDGPITAIQVHTGQGNEDSFLLESSIKMNR